MGTSTRTLWWCPISIPLLALLTFWAQSTIPDYDWKRYVPSCRACAANMVHIRHCLEMYASDTGADVTAMSFDLLKKLVEGGYTQGYPLHAGTNELVSKCYIYDETACGNRKLFCIYCGYLEGRYRKGTPSARDQAYGASFATPELLARCNDVPLSTASVAERLFFAVPAILAGLLVLNILLVVAVDCRHSYLCPGPRPSMGTCSLPWFLTRIARCKSAPPPQRGTCGVNLTEACCPVCGTSFGTSADETVFCVRCDTPHHERCWRFFEKCALYGCGSTARRGKLAFRQRSVHDQSADAGLPPRVPST